MEEIQETFRSYYRQPAVRARILEFLGGISPETATCEYITADNAACAERRPLDPADLFSRLDDGQDICRSLWDRRALIAHLDIEYVNFDFAAEPYLDPERAFDLQEPVVEAIRAILSRHGIRPLHVLSGRGHHFAWSIRRDSELFDRLRVIGGSVTNGCDQYMPCGAELRSLGKAFAGLGLVMEYVGRLAAALASPACWIPVELTAVEVSPSGRGREMISIDLSEYGDPLQMRTVRVPFGAYLKPWHQIYAMGCANMGRIGPIIFVPVDGMDTHRAVHVMRDPELAANLAKERTTTIPDHTEGSISLLAAYERSELKEFHAEFYAESHDPPERWPETYDRLCLENLPEAARNALMYPNDLLLRPVGMRAVTEALITRGWHPRHIAGLVRSKFERDYSWGNQWNGYSPAMRADFYVRIFACGNQCIAADAELFRLRDVAAVSVPVAGAFHHSNEEGEQ